MAGCEIAQFKHSHAGKQQSTLLEIFDSALKKHEGIVNCEEPSNTASYQKLLTDAVSLLEQATHMVNDLALFSSNEHIDEISTSHLRYLLLPSLLGDVTMKLISDDRLEVIETGEAYFIDYLTRCRDYSIINQEIPIKCESEKESPTICDSRKLNMKAMQSEREAKIMKFKKKKEREDKIKKMGTWREIRNRDDEIQREFYKLMLESWVDESLEQLNSIKQEKEILKYMQKAASSEDAPNKTSKPRKPMKPLIITRDSVQAKVFGAGYPSLPTVTLEEFFEKEVREGKIRAEAINPASVVVEHGEQNDETEQLEKDEEDPEELKKAREFDEWKDDHKRGWGNRYNRS